ncbi:MAG: hypothetical protein ACXWDM_06290 [Nocardioides sp.]
MALVLATTTLVAPVQAQKIRSEFFGMHEHRISAGELPGVTLGSVRLWDTGTTWRRIEGSRGSFNWSPVDNAVETARGAGLRPLLVLGQTPRFHAQHPRAPGAYGEGATSMPNLTAWKRYVSQAAKRYGNSVDYQIWNEPSVINFWTGSVRQMARLTATAGTVITRIVGRRATVVAPSFPLRLTGQKTWFRKFWSTRVGGASVARHLDVVSVNAYPLDDEAPEDSMALIRFAKQALPQGARGKPVWNTEINYGLVSGASGGDPAQKISNARQAAFVARTYLLNAASDVRRVYWYSWTVGKIANTHLVKANQTTLTPAGRAYQVVHDWLVGTNVSTCARARRGTLAGTYTCVARESRREVRRIYWKPSGQPVGITTHRTATRWSDLSGNTTRRTGPFRVRVGGAPIMVTSRR